MPCCGAVFSRGLLETGQAERDPTTDSRWQAPWRAVDLSAGEPAARGAPPAWLAEPAGAADLSAGSRWRHRPRASAGRAWRTLFGLGLLPQRHADIHAAGRCGR